MKRLREVCNIVGVDRHVLQRIGTAKGLASKSSSKATKTKVAKTLVNHKIAKH